MISAVTMQLGVGPPLAGAPFFDGTIRRGDKCQPYDNWFPRIEAYEMVRLHGYSSVVGHPAWGRCLARASALAYGLRSPEWDWLHRPPFRSSLRPPIIIVCSRQAEEHVFQRGFAHV